MNATPIGRDFKRSGRRGGTQFRLSTEFFAGLAIGLAVAVAVFFWQRQVANQTLAAVDAEQPQPRVVRREPTPVNVDEPPREYGFYDMLPKSEVVVPEVDPKAPVPTLPVTPIERPGVYVLQPGVFRNLEEAERLQAKLLRLGVRSTLQRVTIDTDVFHRVRVGPIAELAELNRTRAVLQRAEIDTVLIRVGD